ncbi:hypothetical protein pb186bvf_006197 [Paramecium bursaria]
MQTHKSNNLQSFPNLSMLCERDQKQKRSVEQLLASKPNVVKSLDIYAQNMELYIKEQQKRLKILYHRDKQEKEVSEISGMTKFTSIHGNESLELHAKKLRQKQLYCDYILSKKYDVQIPQQPKPQKQYLSVENYTPFKRTEKIYVPSLEDTQPRSRSKSPPLKLKFNYYIQPSTNDIAIKQAFKLRKNWVELPNNNVFAHFTWLNMLGVFDFGPYSSQTVLSKRKMVNFCEFHSSLTNKTSLFTSFYQFNPELALKYLPFSFPLNFKVADWPEDLRLFCKMFGGDYEIRFPFYIPQRKSDSELTQQLFEQYKDKDKLWILKPTDWGRGQGVEIIRTLEQLEKSIVKMYTDKKQDCKEFLLQRYIESPLLFKGRKFDVRCFVLASQENYIYQKGYARISSVNFDLKSDDQFVHLTNTAIQSQHQSFSKEENKNQINFDDLANFINSSGGSFEKVYQDFKKIAQISLNCTKINRRNRKYCFQLLGFDYIIDSAFNVFLIEINANPNLENLNHVPQLIDDTLKLTADVVFPIEYSKEHLYDIL